MKVEARFRKGADFMEKGGLAQVHSPKGLPRLGFTLSLLKDHKGSVQAWETFFLWVSDEGYLFPETLSQRFHFPLQQLVLAKVPTALDVWKVALEATQSGLFGWIFLRPSRGCPPAFLRKLQLHSERMRSRIIILCPEKLPHWLLKTSWELEESNVEQAFPLSTGESLRRESR